MKIRKGVVIFIFGFIGMIVGLSNQSLSITSKVPIFLFFLMIILIGIMIEMQPKEMLEGVYGEVQTKKGFS